MTSRVSKRPGVRDPLARGRRLRPVAYDAAAWWAFSLSVVLLSLVLALLVADWAASTWTAAFSQALPMAETTAVTREFESNTGRAVHGWAPIHLRQFTKC